MYVNNKIVFRKRTKSKKSRSGYSLGVKYKFSVKSNAKIREIPTLISTILARLNIIL